MTIADILRAAASRLADRSATPRLDAEILLAHALGWPRARLLAERGQRPDAGQIAAFEAMLARRRAQEPVAYIVGEREFYGLMLYVDRRVLVPRPETELLVELALQRAAGSRQKATSGADAPDRPTDERRATTGRHPLTIADIGTGSGAIAIALAVHLPEAQVFATDLSAGALEVAARNVARHGVQGRVRLLHGDLLAPLPGPVDLIVSNPPYTILAEVEPNVRAHEPWLALEGGPDGAAVYRRLLADVARYVRPGGAVLLEIGAWQGALVAELLREALPGAAVRVHQDLAGLDRVVGADLSAG